MERQNKTNFIATSNKKIEMYHAFQEAITALEAVVSKYNDKKMDKRFIGAINNMFDEKNIKVQISFDTDYRGDRTNHFKLYYSDRDMPNGGYLSYESAHNYLYACDSRSPYISEDTFRLNAEEFLKTLHREYGYLVEKIEDYTEGIKQVDECIKAYAELNKIIKDTLGAMPKCLGNQYVSITCPIY
ncbi:MAG: hypothetical protein K2H20_04115 [Bacilli bacterium]|nr:hypothetical protein [Bacilli bacterium]